MDFYDPQQQQDVEDAAAWLREQDAQYRRRGLLYAGRTPIYDVLIEVLRQEPSAVKYLYEQPSDDVLLFAVSQNGHALRTIRHPSETVILAALRSRPDAIEYVKSPSVDVQRLALTKDQAEGRINTELLAFYPSKFSDVVLDELRPGLAAVRQLYAGEEPETMQELYEHFLDAPNTQTALPSVDFASNTP